MSQTDQNPYASPAESGARDGRTSETTKIVVAILKWGGSALLVLIALQALNVVGFTYRQRVPNQPLTNPVSIIRNDKVNEELELADGRVVKRFWENDRLAEILKRTGDNELEVGPSEMGPDKVDIAVREYIFICGIGDPIITIPLIPIRIPLFKRVVIGYGDHPQPDPASVTSIP